MFLGIRVGHPFLQKVQALHASCVTVLQSSRQIYVSLLLYIEENEPQRLLNAHLLLSRPLNCILAKKHGPDGATPPNAPNLKPSSSFDTFFIVRQTIGRKQKNLPNCL